MARGGAGGGREAVGSPRGAPRNKKIVLAWRRDYQINFRGNREKSSLLLPFFFLRGARKYAQGQAEKDARWPGGTSYRREGLRPAVLTTPLVVPEALLLFRSV